MIAKYFLSALLATGVNTMLANEKELRSLDQDKDPRPKTLLVFFDGLRPDYITEQLMPNLSRLRSKGSYGTRHHSVFPTVTRVNAAAYSTGAYPASNGILGNEVYFPEIDKAHSLNTADAEALDKITEATDGHLATAASLGEILQSAGSRMMVFSDGSQGQAYLQNHKVSGGAIVNTDFIRPASFRQEVIAAVGAPPASEELNRSRHAWITDAFLHFGLASDGPLVSAIWYADPDETAHANGVGSPLTLECLKIVDAQLGRILDTLECRGLTESFNIIVSADHGFITRAGKERPLEFLIASGLKQDKHSDDVVLADGAIFVKGHDTEKIRKIVAVLQEEKWIGGIFTKGSKLGSDKGWVDGTLSFSSIHWDHPARAADILFTDNWDDRKNQYGFPGVSYAGGGPGSHGGFSPYEVHIALVVSGPSFKKSYQSDWPTSNVDIAPTILHVYHIPLAPSMDGRVMYELLKDGQQVAPKVVRQTVAASTKHKWGTYQLVMEKSVMGKYTYLNFAKAIRSRYR